MDLHRYRSIWNALAVVEMAEQLYLAYEPHLRVGTMTLRVIYSHGFSYYSPGLLNSVAGVISTLSSIYGAQAGVFGKSEESTIIVTGLLSVICGILVLVYEFWLLRILKSEHNHIMGVEMAGKHGEGVMGEKEDNGR